MKLHELKYTEGSRKTRNRVVDRLPETVKQLAADRRARRQEAVAEFVWASRVVRHRSQDVCRSVASRTSTARSMPS